MPHRRGSAGAIHKVRDDLTALYAGHAPAVSRVIFRRELVEAGYLAEGRAPPHAVRALYAGGERPVDVTS